MNKFKKVKIDFQIYDGFDPRYLSVQDYSDWGAIEEKPSIIEIVLPGTDECLTHYFTKNSTNVFNSQMLNLNCGDCDENAEEDLPDGIYSITVKGSPDKYSKTRKYLRDTMMQLDIDKLLIEHVLSCDSISKSFIKDLEKIDILVRAAKANVRYDNICRAQELLFKAQDKLKSLKNKCK